MKITNREKKFLIVGAGLSAIVLVYYLAALLIPSGEDLTAEVETKRRLLLRQKEEIALEEGYQARIQEYEQRLKENLDRLLSGDNPAAARSELQTLLQDVADQSGVDITATIIQADQKVQDTLTKISVQLTLNCNIAELVRFLTAVENYQKFLKVEELYIQALRMRNRDEIRPQLKVAGYVSTPPPAAAASEKAPGGH